MLQLLKVCSVATNPVLHSRWQEFESPSTPVQLQSPCVIKGGEAQEGRQSMWPVIHSEQVVSRCGQEENIMQVPPSRGCPALYHV